MSLINVTLDTESKEVTVSIDGQSVDGDIKEVRIYKYDSYDDGKPKVDFYACKHGEKMGDVKQVTNLTVYASHCEDKIGKDKDIFVCSEGVQDWVKFLK